jgi:hypothetical protein
MAVWSHLCVVPSRRGKGLIPRPWVLTNVELIHNFGSILNWNRLLGLIRKAGYDDGHWSLPYALTSRIERIETYKNINMHMWLEWTRNITDSYHEIFTFLWPSFLFCNSLSELQQKNKPRTRNGELLRDRTNLVSCFYVSKQISGT